eukprot:TRINITY_DN5223_c0_g1_i2.p1 TRINITY_DN5223_c0_g1~~TRINITY_DN5223_c0_g1_i2.p1  ORF type:complete len:734 (-),score=202.94 TRINITY_DN5223_c0_g1_i2:30-2141(-)
MSSKTKQLCAFFEEKIAEHTAAVQPLSLSASEEYFFATSPPARLAKSQEDSPDGKHKKRKETMESLRELKRKRKEYIESPRISTEDFAVKAPAPAKIDRRLSMTAQKALSRSSSVRRTLRKGDNAAKTAQKSKRIFVVKEILSTETTYVDCLKNLSRVYIKPLQKSGILTSEEISGVFANIEMILNLNSEMLQRFSERILNHTWCPNTSCIGDIFQELVPYLRMYSHYVCNHGSAIKSITELSESKPKFKAFLDEARKDQRLVGHHLHDIMIMPIQRIPRYRLLLLDLVNCTPIDHPDNKLLNESLQAISDLASDLNEKLRDSENQQYMLKLQLQFEDSASVGLIEPHRRFIQEYAMSYKDLCAVKENIDAEFAGLARSDCTLFLFNDSVVIATMKPTTGKYELIAKLPLKNCRVKIDAEDVKNFYFVSPDASTECIVAADDEQAAALKSAIVEQVKAAIQKTPALRVARKNIQMWKDEKGIWQAAAGAPATPVVKLSKEEYEAQKLAATQEELTKLLQANPQLRNKTPRKKILSGVFSHLSPRRKSLALTPTSSAPNLIQSPSTPAMSVPSSINNNSTRTKRAFTTFENQENQGPSEGFKFSSPQPFASGIRESLMSPSKVFLKSPQRRSSMGSPLGLITNIAERAILSPAIQAIKKDGTPTKSPKTPKSAKTPIDQQKTKKVKIDPSREIELPEVDSTGSR